MSGGRKGSERERRGAERSGPAASCRAMARRAGGGGGCGDGGGGVPRRLVLWLALWGLWGGGGDAQPGRGAAMPWGWGTAAACSPRCLHGGLCLGNGTCLCSKGYEGELCQHGNGMGMGCGCGAGGG